MRLPAAPAGPRTTPAPPLQERPRCGEPHVAPHARRANPIGREDRATPLGEEETSPLSDPTRGAAPGRSRLPSRRGAPPCGNPRPRRSPSPSAAPRCARFSSQDPAGTSWRREGEGASGDGSHACMLGDSANPGPDSRNDHVFEVERGRGRQTDRRTERCVEGSKGLKDRRR